MGTLPGSLAERILRREGAQVKTYEGGQDEIYADLRLGRTDAVLLDEPITRYYGAIDPELEVVPGTFGEVRYAVAVAAGGVLALARVYGPLPLRWLATAYIEVVRGTPLLVQLTLVYFGLPQLGLRLEPLTAGVLTLGLNYAAAEAENYRAGLSSVPAGQHEAARVLGLSRWQTLRHVVMPQAVRISLPPMTNDFIALLKDSSLVSLVTLTELTRTYLNLANAMRDHLGLGLLVAALYLLGHRLQAWPEMLSGGQRQRVAIARALAMDPAVLLYDEPTSALDPSLRREVVETLRRVRSLGMTQLVVTHDVQLARAAETVLVLDHGHLVEQGPPAQVLDAPRHEATRRLLAQAND